MIIETLARLLLDSDSAIASGKLKCAVQNQFKYATMSFLVDLHALDDPMVVRADENGVWDCKGFPVAYVSPHRNGGITAVYKRSNMGS